jgi:hypothetical protein
MPLPGPGRRGDERARALTETFTVARNPDPDPDPSLPYLLRLPLSGGDLALRPAAFRRRPGGDPGRQLMNG